MPLPKTRINNTTNPQSSSPGQSLSKFDWWICFFFQLFFFCSEIPTLVVLSYIGHNSEQIESQERPKWALLSILKARIHQALPTPSPHVKTKRIELNWFKLWLVQGTPLCESTPPGRRLTSLVSLLSSLFPLLSLKERQKVRPSRERPALLHMGESHTRQVAPATRPWRPFLPPL